MTKHCEYCARWLPGEAKLLAAFTAPELEKLASDSLDLVMQERLLTMLGLLDYQREAALRAHLKAD